MDGSGLIDSYETTDTIHEEGGRRLAYKQTIEHTAQLSFRLSLNQSDSPKSKHFTHHE